MLYAIVNLLYSYFKTPKAIKDCPVSQTRRRRVTREPANCLAETSPVSAYPEESTRDDGTAFLYKAGERVSPQTEKLNEITQIDSMGMDEETKLDETQPVEQPTEAVDQTLMDYTGTTNESMVMHAVSDFDCPLASSHDMPVIELVPEEMNLSDIESSSKSAPATPEAPYNFRKRVPVYYSAEKRISQSVDRKRKGGLKTPKVIRKEKKQKNANSV